MVQINHNVVEWAGVSESSAEEHDVDCGDDEGDSGEDTTDNPNCWRS